MVQIQANQLELSTVIVEHKLRQCENVYRVVDTSDSLGILS